MAGDRNRIWSPDAIWKTTYWHRGVFEQQQKKLEIPELEVKGGYQLDRELFTRLFSFARKLPEPTPGFEHHEGLWEDLERLPEWQKLRDEVRGWPELAGHATKTIVEELRKQLQKQEEEEPQKSAEEILAELLRKKDKKTGGQPGRAAMRKAARKAAKDIEQVKGLIALGADNSASQPKASDVEAALKLARKVNLRELLRLVGRLMGEASARAAKVMNLSVQEVASIEPGNDLARLISSEFSLIANGAGSEELELLFYQRWLERQLLQYQIIPPKRKMRGPIVVLVDSSGSMDGSSWVVAQAVTLSMIMLARKQKRQVWGVLFDSRAQPAVKLDSLQTTLKFLSTFLGGGTSFDSALKEGLKVIEEQEHRADLVMVTDGWSDVDKETKDRLRRSGARLHMVLVPGGDASSVRDIATTIKEVAADPRDKSVLGLVDVIEEVRK